MGVGRSRDVREAFQEKVFKDQLGVHQAEKRGGHSRKTEQMTQRLRGVKQYGARGELHTARYC